MEETIPENSENTQQVEDPPVQESPQETPQTEAPQEPVEPATEKRGRGRPAGAKDKAPRVRKPRIVVNNPWSQSLFQLLLSPSHKPQLPRPGFRKCRQLPLSHPWSPSHPRQDPSRGKLRGSSSTCSIRRTRAGERPCETCTPRICSPIKNGS